MKELNQGSLRSSPRYGLSTTYRLTQKQCWTVPPCSYLCGRPPFCPSCTEFSTLDAGILIMVQQVRLIMFSLNMLDNSMSFLSLSTLIFVGLVKQFMMAPMILVSAPVPLVLILVLNWVGLGWGCALGVWGIRVWGQGLTI